VADDSSITVQIDANTEGLDEGIARAKDAADSFVAHITAEPTVALTPARTPPVKPIVPCA
jgi:uncharacterized membrane protein YdfJ with MMPL/SSD domain